MHLYEVLRRPVITEKSTVLAGQNKYAFEVAEGSNKKMIKDAVEKAFKVSVLGVNVISMKPNTKRVGRRQVQTAPWKKAIVTLQPGDKIEFFEGV